MTRRRRAAWPAARRAAIAPALAALALAGLAGCGFGSGEGVKAVTITATDDFGSKVVAERRYDQTPGDETVMRLLQRSAKVTTRYGGGFVQSIDGVVGQTGGGSQVDWFYYVNGIEASKGAGEVDVQPGDRIWWDRHDWSGAMRIPAVVGSFPEPFLSGRDGRRLPVRVECAEGATAACDEVSKRLDDAGVPVSRSIIGAEAGEKVLRVLVGRWTDVRADISVRQIEAGPQTSGVFARIAPDGQSMGALDARGQVRRRITAGGGLIAATQIAEQQTAWVVTGLDDAGLLAAAQALDEGTLSNHFALAVDRGQGVPVPVTGR